ncbi:alpha/beta fold hydrolase [Pseudosulfitobacter koreensis]|uniref:Alpha/beta hydrolase n=1 Tax=Pseudosulfitobacter koreensis TaxID=2968472 RepID=A0ABT1YZJ2_9RHOB|nr:alpha/beta hydrolase [Pseudosulfitobacter koreense]MCR8826308.1 alpha/beta hydrolase [Pseudosulfitobacter koreense]
MSFEPAPLFLDRHPGPPGGQAHWAMTSDGLRVRVAHWNASAPKGTVLLFPGRTEYVEKYAPVASELAARGLATVTIDWRGQGLADRMLDEVRTGHVIDFLDYQKDLACMVALAREMDLPQPWFLLGHSMGGCIGLRSLYEGVPVKAAAFTGPMWGIRIARHLRPVAWVLSQVMPRLGHGHRLPPGTKLTSYVMSDPFEDNLLTRDREMWDMMVDQLNAHPDLSLGGPSLTWLREALSETEALSRMQAPDLPCIAFMGTNERIVHTDRVIRRMDSWPKGDLVMVEDGEHEVMMEGPAKRGPIFDRMVKTFFDAA